MSPPETGIFNSSLTDRLISWILWMPTKLLPTHHIAWSLICQSCSSLDMVNHRLHVCRHSESVSGWRRSCDLTGAVPLNMQQAGLCASKYPRPDKHYRHKLGSSAPPTSTLTRGLLTQQFIWTQHREVSPSLPADVVLTTFSKETVSMYLWKFHNHGEGPY